MYTELHCESLLPGSSELHICLVLPIHSLRRLLLLCILLLGTYPQPETSLVGAWLICFPFLHRTQFCPQCLWTLISCILSEHECLQRFCWCWTLDKATCQENDFFFFAKFPFRKISLNFPPPHSTFCPDTLRKHFEDEVLIFVIVCVQTHVWRVEDNSQE